MLGATPSVEKVWKKSSVFGETARRRCQAKLLKAEMEECVTRLSKGEIMLELRQECYSTAVGAIDRLYAEYSELLSKRLGRIRAMASSLEDADEQQRRECEIEYRRILAGLAPPAVEVVKKDDMTALKTELNGLKRDRISRGGIFQGSRTPTQVSSAESDSVLRLARNIMEKAYELQVACNAGSPLGGAGVPESQANVAELLSAADKRFANGIAGVKLVMKARREIHERLTSELVAANSGSLAQMKAEIESQRETQCRLECELAAKTSIINKLSGELESQRDRAAETKAHLALCQARSQDCQKSYPNSHHRAHLTSKIQVESAGEENSVRVEKQMACMRNIQLLVNRSFPR